MIITIIIKIKIIITIGPRDQEILGWCPAGDKSQIMRRGILFSLGWQSFWDAVSIKVLVWRHLNPTLSYYEWIMSSYEIQTKNMNGSRLAEKGPLSSKCSQQGNIGRHHVNPVISKRRKWTSHKRVRLLWSAIYWVSFRGVSFRGIY